MNQIKHKIGEDMYVDSAMYISRGIDDRIGGLAKIKDIEISDTLPIEHGNAIFISFEEFPGTSFNYKSLLEKQDKLKAKFGNNRAYPDPDINTPWAEDGDILNGSVYRGKNIW